MYAQYIALILVPLAGALILFNKGFSHGREARRAWKKTKKVNHETCIVCGEIIPEGRQVCPKCEEGWKDK